MSPKVILSIALVIDISLLLLLFAFAATRESYWPAIVVGLIIGLYCSFARRRWNKLFGKNSVE